MSIIKRMFRQNGIDDRTENGYIHVPVKGEVIELKQMHDGIFSEGVLGPGCAIIPTDEMVVAPFDGEIIQLAETKHAFGMKSKDGIELIIHVGIDTVDMNGSGFEVAVALGQEVKAGQLILRFSTRKIKEAGHVATVVVIVTNEDDFSTIELECLGNVTYGDRLIHLNK